MNEYGFLGSFIFPFLFYELNLNEIQYNYVLLFLIIVYFGILMSCFLHCSKKNYITILIFFLPYGYRLFIYYERQVNERRHDLHRQAVGICIRVLQYRQCPAAGMEFMCNICRIYQVAN